ncbi:NAD-dependent epimerase/dehydratase family protein [Bradyrhizobium sp. STM 3562]|uniref:NAD-dependent epimerase/dehydratase family protein n=1 Tax=Bradyrhizobium sp. STM 3562 TaxID=578924 RepID=UPI003890B57B
MKVVVLGGGGFIGTHLCRQLVKAGFEVSAFGRSFLNLRALKGVNVITGDFSDETILATAIHGAEIVYHLIHATLPNIANIEMVADIQKSVVGTVRMLEAAVSNGVSRVVFVSSGGTIYGPTNNVPITEDHPTNPIGAYGINKLAIEKYVQLFERLHGLRGFSVRLANPFGPLQTGIRHQGLIPTVVRQMIRDKPVTIFGDGSNVRDYVYIDDAISALISLGNYQGQLRNFNVGGSDGGKSILQIVSAIESALGQKAKLEFAPARTFDVPMSILCCERIKRETGWKPVVPFVTALRETIDWLKDEGEFV